MRKLEIKHPEHGRFGVLGQYDARRLVHDSKLPPRIDFHPHILPQVGAGHSQPDLGHKEQVSEKSLDILGKIFVDGQPLTDLYDWKMEVSSFNPHGWGEPKWHYYMVGSLKSPARAELKEIVLEVVLKVMNEDTKVI